MDRAYLDFQRLYQLHQSSAVFVTRSKTNTGLRRIYSHKVDKATGVKFDQTVALTGFYSKRDNPEKLRRIKYFDAEKGRSFIFLTNQFTLPAITSKDRARPFRIGLYPLRLSAITDHRKPGITLVSQYLTSCALADAALKKWRLSIFSYGA